MLDLLWLLQYFHLAFACDTPILECLWITGDRVEAEFAKILPLLDKQLLFWGFGFGGPGSRPEHPFWFRYRFRENRTCTKINANNIGFSITRNGQTTFFMFRIGYPRNHYAYENRTSLSQGIVHLHRKCSHENREDWYKHLVRKLMPKEVDAALSLE
jgi:hypothetical protein